MHMVYLTEIHFIVGWRGFDGLGIGESPEQIDGQQSEGLLQQIQRFELSLTIKIEDLQEDLPFIGDQFGFYRIVLFVPITTDQTQIDLPFE